MYSVGTVLPSFHCKYMHSIWYFIQFVCIVIFMRLNVSAAARIPVASTSPIHVPPVQHVLKHCGVHKHNILHTRDPKQS